MIYDDKGELLYITAVRRKRGDLYEVYSGDEIAAVIDAQTFTEEDGVAAGEYISESELERVTGKADRRLARNKALGIVSRREISSALLIRKLKDSGFGEDAAEYAAEEMERLGFVNDERCAEMMAEDIYHLKHFARRRCAYELTQKGIDRELAESTAARLEPEPKAAIFDLLTGKLARDMDSEAGIKRSTNTLIRYGFEPSDIREVLARLRDELDDDE